MTTTAPSSRALTRRILRPMSLCCLGIAVATASCGVGKSDVAATNETAGTVPSTGSTQPPVSSITHDDDPSRDANGTRLNVPHEPESAPTGIGTADGGGDGEQPTKVDKLTDGHWRLTVDMVEHVQGASQGTSADAWHHRKGGGEADVKDGVVSGSVAVSGGGAGTVTSPGNGCTVDGVYSQTGPIHGSAAAPTLDLALSFNGTVSCTEGGTRSSSTGLGTVTVATTLVSATPDVVVFDIVQPPAPIGATYFADRIVARKVGECPANTKKTEKLPWGIKGGTADRPTKVHLDVDESISSRPDLLAKLQDSVAQWNAILAAGDQHIVIEFGGAAAGPTPDDVVVHVGVDSPTMRAKLPTTDDDLHKPVNRPVTDTAWTQAYRFSDPAGNTYGSKGGPTDGRPQYTEEAAIRLNESGLAKVQDPDGDQDWNDIAKTEPMVAEIVFNHEIGHVMGLDHSKDPSSIMYTKPHSLRKRQSSTINCGDIAGVKGR